MRSSQRLDPAPTAPALARQAIAAALPGPDQADLRDTAALLVSELVTNAVVHAASAIELDIEVTDDAVTVRVCDADTGPLVLGARGTELDEGGRGFLLIDRLAQAWGTEHHAGRKTVWFRLGAPPTPPDHEPSRPGETASPRQMSLQTLLLPPTLADVVSFEEHVTEILARALEAAPVHGLRLVLDANGERSIASGEVGGTEAAVHQLVIDDRVIGRLEVYADAALDPDTRAFAALVSDRVALLAASHGLLQLERTRAADLDLLTEATELLTRSLSVSLSLALVTQIVVPRLAEWCAAYAVDDRGRPRRLTVNHRIEERTDAVKQVLDHDRDVLTAVAEVASDGTARRLPVTVSVGGQRNHVSVLPLSSRSRVLGVLVLGRSQPLDPMGYMAATELARRAALAVDNARLHEQQASTVTALQSSLLPTALPELAEVQVAARYHSASADVSVGGDFYDAFLLPDGALAVAIGDVCGKGAEAAAVTGMMRDILRLLLQDGVGLSDALRRLNRALADHPNRGRFCTVAVARIDLAADDMPARVCLAGHPEPVLLRADGTTELVGSPGDLLGVLADDVLQVAEVDVPLGPGDSLVLYTDGVTERRDGGAMFGQYGVRRTLQDAVGADADGLAERLETAARLFVDTELRDDVAILVVQRRIG